MVSRVKSKHESIRDQLEVELEGMKRLRLSGKLEGPTVALLVKRLLVSAAFAVIAHDLKGMTTALAALKSARASIEQEGDE